MRKIKSGLLLLWTLMDIMCYSSEPQLVISPPNPYVGEVLHIEAKGFHSHEKVKILASQIDEQGRRWESHATFQANEKGGVDLSSTLYTLYNYAERRLSFSLNNTL